MTPEQLSAVILAGVGVLIQVAFKYLPKFKVWYSDHPNKGAVALVFDVVFGAAYFGLACTPFAEELNVLLACDTSSAFVLLRAIFIVATAQQGAYLFSRSSSAG